MAKILAIDDDRQVRRLIESALSDLSHHVILASDGTECMELMRTESVDVAILDVMLPRGSGLDLMEQMHEVDFKLPIIVISSSDDSDVVMDATKTGAFDFLKKPLSIEDVQEVVERACEVRRLMNSPVALGESQESSRSDALIGSSPEMLEVYKDVGRVAEKDVSVLIRGESGTGKELIARAIYHHSLRKDRIFLAVNCAALSDSLLESELFGHEKGAFTGATSRRIGKFEQCDGGTIFLDEVGDMSLNTQSKVLRLLQQQQFERLGGTETIETDVRIISATNRDLETMMQDGEFRLDLYHRLNSYEIHIPPLKDRREDIPRLALHYLKKLNESLQTSVTGISEEALETLKRYEWPGNVRELQSVIRRALLTATGPVIVSDCFEDALSADPVVVGVDGYNAEMDFERFLTDREACETSNLYDEALEWMERRLVTRVLKKTGGNQSRAAELLGITRGNLRNKIRYLGIEINQVVVADG